MATAYGRLAHRETASRSWSVPAQATWLAPLITVATLFFLWPMLNVIRIAFTDTTLLRDGYSYTLQTFSQTLSDPALPKVLGVTAVFVGASVAGQLLLGLCIALIMQRAVARKLRDIFEARTVAELADRIKTLKWLVPGENPIDEDVEEREEIEI